MKSKHTILVFGNKLIGDAIDSLHSAYSLYLQNPEAEYYFIGYRYSASLYQFVIPFKKVYFLEDGFWNRLRFYRLVKKELKHKIDLAFILPGGWGFSFLSKLLKAKRTVGHQGDHRSKFLTESVASSRTQENYKNFNDLFYLIYPTSKKIVSAKLEKVPFEFKDFNFAKPFVVFSIMASEPIKIWGQQNFIKLAEKIKKEFNWEIVFVGTEGEYEAINEVANASQVKGINLAGKISLKEVFYLINEANFFVGNDSGLTHAAGLLKAPSFTIVGPTNPVLSFPLSQYQNDYFIYHDLKDIPAEKRREKKYLDRVGIDLVTVEEVFDEIKKNIK